MGMREKVARDLKRVPEKDLHEDGMRIEYWELELGTVTIEVSADRNEDDRDWTADIWLDVPAGRFQLTAGGEDNYVARQFPTKEDAALGALGHLGAIAGAINRYIQEE